MATPNKPVTPVTAPSATATTPTVTPQPATPPPAKVAPIPATAEKSAFELDVDRRRKAGLSLEDATNRARVQQQKDAQSKKQ